MYILGFIALFLIIGFLIGFFAEDEIAYGLILIITIAWIFAYGPWAIATLIELVIGYSLGSKVRPIAGDIFVEKIQEFEEEQEESSNLFLWLLCGSAGGLFLLTEVLSYTNSGSETNEKQPVNIQQVIQKHPFTIKTLPANARVRIMNIKPKYRDGIELEDGAYDMLVDAAGYYSWRKIIQHSGKATNQQITLRKK